MDSPPTLARTCSLHGRPQCCLSSPQFLEYIATYSTSQTALVSPDSTSHSTSESSTSTVVNVSPPETAPAQKTSEQSTPPSPSITPTSILIKARENLDVPPPATPSPALPSFRRHSSPTAVPEPLRSPPTSPPPVQSSTPNSPTNRPMTDSTTVTPPPRRRTLDFATDENAARRDSRAVNALPKPTKPIYPRAKITKAPAKPYVPATTRNATQASGARFRAMAPPNDGSKVTTTSVTPPESKIINPSVSITNTPSAKPTAPQAKSSSTPPMPATAPKPAPPTPKLPNPANHVHLSRKTDTIPVSFFAKLFSSKSAYKKRQSEISDIKDVFVIDPDLVLPRGMFRALDDIYVGLGRKDSFDYEGVGERGGDQSQQQQHPQYHGIALKRSRTFSGAGSGSRKNSNNALAATLNDTSAKKNLKLEVQNGGIDVDVHLVPTVERGSTTATMLLPMPTKRTTIDLRLLPDDNFKPGNHPLVARIHAPEKRAPFHLTARTYTLPLPPLPPPAIEPTYGTSPTPSTSPIPVNLSSASAQKLKPSVLKQHRRAATSPSSLNSLHHHHTHHPASLSTISLSSPSYNTSPLSSSSTLSSAKFSSNALSFLDKSNMEIQIPRSYNGPITIHVASGNLDEHIAFSRDVKERSVVLREGRYARGCFVGRQGFDEEEESGEDGDETEDGGGADEDAKGKGECEVCGKKTGEEEKEERKVVVLQTKTSDLKENVSTKKISSDTPRSSSRDTSSSPTTPLRIVKRKPAKAFALPNSEKDSISSSPSPSRKEPPSIPSPPSSPPPPPPPPTSSPIPNSISPSPPLITKTPPLDILTNRPSFLDTDPSSKFTSNLSPPYSSHDHHTKNVVTPPPPSSSPGGWKYNQNLEYLNNSRAKRLAELYTAMAAPHRSSPLRYSVTTGSESPPSPVAVGLPVTLEEGARGGGVSAEAEARRELEARIEAELEAEEERDAVPPLREIEDRYVAVSQRGGVGSGSGPTIVGLDDMSSLPSSSSSSSSSSSEEEGEEEENDEAGSGSGSGVYESAESGSGNDDVEEPSTTTTTTTSTAKTKVDLGNQPVEDTSATTIVRCTCTPQAKQQYRQQKRERMKEERRSRKRKEWIGDRMDIMIGRGKVKIKYDDEVEDGGLSRGKKSGRWFGW